MGAGSTPRLAPATGPAGQQDLGVIILAAGASRRMGRPKMLLPWRQTTIIGHVIGQWEQLGAGQITVVHAEGDNALMQELDRLEFPERDRIANASAHLGMFSSIVTAARWGGWQTAVQRWAIVLGDQPHLPENGLRRLLEFAATHPYSICQPGFRGRPRHPVLLARSAFEAIVTTTAEHLKQFLSMYSDQQHLLPLDEPAFDFDIDRPEDYDLALQLFSHGRIDALPGEESNCTKGRGK